MQVIGWWGIAWSELRRDLTGWWRTRSKERSGSNGLKMNYLYDAYSRSTYWRMYSSISVMSMTDVWYSCKLIEIIFRSVRGLALIKARIHAGLIHRSSVYIVNLNIWSCRWIWWLLQSSVSTLCSGDGVVNRVSVIQSFVWLWASILLLGPVWKLDEMWPFRLCVVLQCIQSENWWNAVPGGEKIVGKHLRTSI